MKRTVTVILICLVCLAVIAAIALATIGAGNGNKYRPDAKQVEKLNKTEVLIDGNRRTYGPASMRRKGAWPLFLTNSSNASLQAMRCQDS
jgi:hypothetical protein